MHRLRLALFAFILAAAFAYSTPLYAQDKPDAPAGGNQTFLPLIQWKTNSTEETTAQETNLVVRLTYRSPGESEELLAQLDVLEESCGKNCLEALVSPADYQRLVNEGRMVEIDHERTAQLASDIARVQQAFASGAQAINSIPGYACYRTVEETYSSLAALAASHPQIATWIDIGDTWEKVTPGGAAGYDMYALKLTNKRYA